MQTDQKHRKQKQCFFQKNRGGKALRQLNNLWLLLKQEIVCDIDLNPYLRLRICRKQISIDETKMDSFYAVVSITLLSSSEESSLRSEYASSKLSITW